jgi:hypothetical protein
MTPDAANTEGREERAIRDVIDRLTQEFAADYSTQHVAQTITTIHHRFDGRPVRAFIPLLVERFARQELRSLATD